jgi:shikimate kinase
MSPAIAPSNLTRGRPPGRYRVAVAPTSPPSTPLVVALVGMMGSGKSSVGAALAARTGRVLVDLDEAIEQAAGRSVAELFAEEGEAAFRTRELDALMSVLATRSATVVATGGGVVTIPEARAALSDGATVVWLDAPAEVLAERVGAGQGRPLLAGDPSARLRALDAERRPLYSAVADLVVDAADGSPDAVADRVLAALEVRV